MFAVFEIAGFLVALITAIVIWRKDSRVVVKLSVWAASTALVLLAFIGATGVPLLLHRFQRATFGNATVSTLSQLHHHAGHWFVTGFVLIWPVLFVASVARPKTRVRKLVLGIVAIANLLIVLFVSFTGYALPPGMPRELAMPDAAHALRFVVLHVVFGPALGVLTLLILAWRHARATRR